MSTIHQNFDYIGHWLLKSAQALSKGQVCQSSQTPKLRMLVRDSCGGRDKITPAFCSQFEYIDITDDNAAAPEPADLDQANATQMTPEVASTAPEPSTAVG